MADTEEVQPGGGAGEEQTAVEEQGPSGETEAAAADAQATAADAPGESQVADEEKDEPPTNEAPPQDDPEAAAQSSEQVTESEATDVAEGGETQAATDQDTKPEDDTTGEGEDNPSEEIDVTAGAPEATETQQEAEPSAETTEATETRTASATEDVEPTTAATDAPEDTGTEQQQQESQASEPAQGPAEDGRRSGACSRGSTGSRGSHRVKDKEREKSFIELGDTDKARCRVIFDRRAIGDRLDLKGFKILFRLMGEILSSEEAENMFDKAIKDDNGTIDFDQFCRLVAKFRSDEQERKSAMRTSLDKLFPSNDGEPVELKKVEKLLLKLQNPNLDMRLVREKSDLSAGDVRHFVRSMDTEGNGLVSKEKFVNTLCQHLDLDE